MSSGVYKIHYLSNTDVTFVLTSGGHNAGIVSELGHPRRRYRIALKRTADPCLGPDEWAAAAESKDESWWIDWLAWLIRHAAPERVSTPLSWKIRTRPDRADVARARTRNRAAIR